MSGPFSSRYEEAARTRRLQRAMERLLKVIEGVLVEAPAAERLTLALAMAGGATSACAALMKDMRGQQRGRGPTQGELEEVCALLLSANAFQAEPAPAAAEVH